MPYQVTRVPLCQHENKAVGISGFDTMHDTGRRENHATGLDRNIVPIFEGYDPFSLNDIKYLVLDRVFCEAGRLSGLETDKIAHDTF